MLTCSCSSIKCSSRHRWDLPRHVGLNVVKLLMAGGRRVSTVACLMMVRPDSGKDMLAHPAIIKI